LPKQPAVNTFTARAVLTSAVTVDPVTLTFDR